MLKGYNTLYAQSLFDVCLNSYGTLNRYGRIMADNSIKDANYKPPSNTELNFDTDLIFDQLIYNQKYTYVTSYSVTASPEQNGVVLVDETSTLSEFTPIFIPLLSEDKGYYLIPE